MSKRATPILTFYSPSHPLHAPQREYLHGKTIPYAEQPARLENIRRAIEQAGLVHILDTVPILPDEAILKAHDAGMVKFLSQAATIINAAMDSHATAYQTSPDQQYFYPSVFPVRSLMNRIRTNARGPHGFYFFDTEAPIGKGTWQAALQSASLAYAGAEKLLVGEVALTYALCRPPGHHAGTDFMGGYCYLNNAAIAARHLQQMGRVVVLDIDYHHGNGTQAIFWDTPDVLFISLHVDPETDYPYYSGYADETGAQGTIINKPLPPQTYDVAYLAVLDEILPAIQHFSPRSLVVSLGFDTYEHDPLGTFRLTQGCYFQIARKLNELNLPTLIIQEGGYAVDSLGELAVEFLKGFVVP